MWRALGFACVSICLLASAAHAAPTISWKVENRFRLFEPTVGDRESKLLDILAKHERIGDAVSEYTPLLQADASKSSLYWNTQYDRNTGRYKPGYATPTVQVIDATLQGVDPAAECVWSVAGHIEATGPCGVSTPLSLSFSPDYVARAEVKVSAGGATYKTMVVSKDRLVVVFGDSYAAGEGDPDRPANLKHLHPKFSGRPEDWWHPLFNMGGVLAKDDGADWWSNECHRSLFSGPAVASMKLAADHPHDSVTFMSFACAGAAVLDGLVAPQFTPPGKSRIGDLNIMPVASIDSQLEQAAKALCSDRGQTIDGTIDLPPGTPNWKFIYKYKAVKADAEAARMRPAQKPNPDKPACLYRSTQSPDQTPIPDWKRKPDLVLISIGGNDAGFAGLGGWAILPASKSALTQLLENAFNQQSWNQLGVVCPMVPLIDDHGQSDPRCNFPGNGNWGADELINDELPHLLSLAQDTLSGMNLLDPSTLVIQVGYPAPFTDQNGNYCGSPTKHPSQLEFSQEQSAANASISSTGPPEFKNDSDAARPWLAYHAMLYYFPSLTFGTETWKVAALSRDTFSELNGKLALAASSQVARDQWVFADISQKFANHGFCAGNKGDAREDFKFPKRVGLPWLPTWLPGSWPSAWVPYDTTRARWIRVADDSLLTEAVSNPKGAIQFEALDGTFHPTESGYAAMADTVREALYRKEPDLAPSTAAPSDRQQDATTRPTD